MRMITLVEQSCVAGGVSTTDEPNTAVVEAAQASHVLAFFATVMGIAGGVAGNIAWSNHSPILSASSRMGSIFSGIALFGVIGCITGAAVYARLDPNASSPYYGCM